MQEKRKRNPTGIIVAVATVIVVVILMVVWGKYEAKHKEELKTSLLTTAKLDVSKEDPSSEPIEEVEKPRRVIPDDPEKILVMVEEAFKDEGYFDQGDILKGFHVYSLLKKCLDCKADCDKVAELDCKTDCDKVAELVNRLKERSSKTYGAWHVERDLLVDLDDSLTKARENM